MDLTLISLNDIEQIEIVEAAMGVQSDTNDVSAIINIITKKWFKQGTQIKSYLKEETVGKEYEWFDKGRHIQSLQINHNLNNHIYANSNYFRNDFGGSWGEKQGEQYDKNSLQPAEQHYPLFYNRKKSF